MNKEEVDKLMKNYLNDTCEADWPVMGKRRQGGHLARAFVLLAMLLSGVELRAVVFTNVTIPAGVDYVQWILPSPTNMPYSEIPFMTGGAAAGDFDGDGWPDLYVTRLDASGILFRNRGNGTFEDVTANSGLNQALLANGAAWGDVDNDGDLDLYVTAISATNYFLFINDGSGRFTEEAVARGAAVADQAAHQGWSVSFGDYDRDGWLDIHTTEWTDIPQPPEAISHSRLLRNRGSSAPGHFTDVTGTTGVEIPVHIRGRWGFFSFTSSFSDLDGDGWPDLVVAGDFGTSRLFWNNGNGTFSDGTGAAGVGTDENGMGSAIGDFDGDGRLDWFVTAIYDPSNTCATVHCGWGATGNRLFRNRGDRTFEDRTTAAGVRDGGWGWGAAWFDYDNDGDLDLVMVNGVNWVNYPSTPSAPYATDRTRLWRNDGGVFTDVTSELGITDNGSGKGLLVFDYDRDGDLDLFIVNNAGHPVLYRNAGGNSNNWLEVKLVGHFSNRDGIGARITIEPTLGGLTQVREISGGSHFLAQSEPLAHFGLGQHPGTVARVTIKWPSGLIQVLRNVSVNALTVVPEQASLYDEWCISKFSKNELGDPNVSGPSADPDGDGFPNFVEFAFNLEPKLATTNKFVTAVIEQDANDHNNYLLFSYTRRKPSAGIAYAAEVSADLTVWGCASVCAEEIKVVAAQEPFMETVTVRIKPAVNATNRQFVRITVSPLANPNQ